MIDIIISGCQTIMHKHPGILSISGTAGVAAGITIASINPYLTAISLLIAIGYGVWRWNLEARKEKREHKEFKEWQKKHKKLNK